MVEEDMHNIVMGPQLERSIDVSLGELLLLMLKTHQDNVIQIDALTDEKLSADVLLKKAIKLAKWLRNYGIGIGDSISINSENRLEFCVIPVATLLVGATFTPLNPDYTSHELKHVLNLSKPKMIFCSSRTIDKMVGLRSDNQFIKELILFETEETKYKDVIMYERLLEGAEADEIDTNFEATPVDPKTTVATILYSSGTTGLPKGVMCTQDSMTAFIDISRIIANEIIMNDDPNDALMGLVPFFHSFGFMLMFLNLLRGKKMIVMGRFKPTLFLDTLVKYKVARLIVAPPVFLFLLKHPLVKRYNLSFIKEMRSGAAPMGKDMENELRERFKVNQVSQGYGLTETTLAVTASPYGQHKVGSVGKLVPGMLAKIIDEKGEALGTYGEGEICLKGPLIMKGYIGDPEATQSMLDDMGWLHTGDVAYYDDDGYFFIVDRIKELIKYKAFQVPPAELEALLLTHPAVADAAVIGLPNEDAGELPLAYIVKKPGQHITEHVIEKFVADNVSPQKRLRGGVIFVDEIPKNPSGKILRRVLRQQATKLKSKL